MGYRFYGPVVYWELRKLSEQATIGYGEMLKDEIKAACSKPSPPVSSPGEFPRQFSGEFVGSIVHVHSGGKSRVGSTLPLGKWLEFGTKKMAARPWLSKGTFEFCRSVRTVGDYMIYRALEKARLAKVAGIALAEKKKFALRAKKRAGISTALAKAFRKRR